MSLVNKEFLIKQLSNILIRRTAQSIKIRSIEVKVHDSFEYVEVDVYITKKITDDSDIEHLKIEFHLIDDFKINVLIEMNIMKLENIIFNFEKKIMVISTCENLEASISIQKKKTSINRTIRASAQIIISIGEIMAVPIHVKNNQMSTDKDYSFFSKIDRMLNSEKGFFAHVIETDLIAVQMKNTSAKSYIIFKNLKVNHFRDFEKEGCFLTTSQNRHLTIAFVNEINLRGK